MAVGLPFAIAIPWLLRYHEFESSISGYYYTGMRNLFVGSLCAVAMFLFSCRGFDTRDEIAGYISAGCAVGVAFFPTTPAFCVTLHQRHIGEIHYTFAAGLFLTLAYFCFFLFTLTHEDREPTPEKLKRNKVYRFCGWVIVGSIAAIAVTKITGFDFSFHGLGPVFVFEATSLLAFGGAWLIKGDTLLRDQPAAVVTVIPATPEPASIATGPITPSTP